MAQSLAKVLIHIVFSTKDRRPFLQDSTVRRDLHAYLATICTTHDCPTLIVGGVEDHVHILCSLARTLSIANLIRELKRSSSSWIKTVPGPYAQFHWQNGYGAFSVSQSNAEAVRQYIRTQEEHHRTISFQDEFRSLLERHGIEYDERYVWD